jgi:hypothetical protein
MQSYKSVAQLRNGNVVPGAFISVYDAGTTNFSTIYSDNSSTALTNDGTVFTSNADGFYEFWAADGRYDVFVTYQGDSETTSGIILFDPTGGGNTTALTVDASQNVGIGISTPDTKLHVWESDAGAVSVYTSTVLSVEMGGVAGPFFELLSADTCTGAGLLFSSPSSNGLDNSFYFNHVLNDLSLRVGGAQRANFDASSNWLMASASVGTSGTGVFCLNNGTEPTTSPAGVVQIYSKDSSDGAANATLGIRTEQAVEAIGTFTPSHKHKIWLNGVEYWIQLDAV